MSSETTGGRMVQTAAHRLVAEVPPKLVQAPQLLLHQIKVKGDRGVAKHDGVSPLECFSRLL